jgi:predicted nucleotidyltransferase
MAASDESGKAAGIEFYGVAEVYDENGVDLTTLRRNRMLSLENRLENNARAAAFFAVLRASKHAPDQPMPARTPKPFTLDIATLLRVLLQHKVEFVVIGGVAMIAHGSNYVTADMDICYNRTPHNLGAVAAALTSLHAYLRGAPKGLPFKTDVPTLQAGLNFTLETDSGDLDLLGEVSGVGGYARALAQSEEREVYGCKVRVLSIDGLIAAKKAAARNKDQSHLLELEALKKLRDAGGPGV